MSSYGDEPCQSPPHTPLTLSDWPLDGEKAFIYLGAPYEPIFSSIIRSQAIGAAALLKDPMEFRKGVIKLVENADRSRKWNWYISILLERRIELDDFDLQDDEFIWLKPEVLGEINWEFKNYGSPHLDLLESYVAASIPPQFFERKIVDDRVFVMTEDKEPFGNPEAQSGNATHLKN